MFELPTRDSHLVFMAVKLILPNPINICILSEKVHIEVGWRGGEKDKKNELINIKLA